MLNETIKVDFEQEYNELKKEFDRIFCKLYLAEEENKLLLKQNKQYEKKLDMLIERIVDLSHMLGIEPSF